MKTLSENEIQEQLKALPHWTYENNAIHTSLEFEDFTSAFSAMTKMAFEAERLQHHPNWYNVYNTVEISLSTHDAGGVTQKDFELALAFEKVLS
jgi:4a-hydroxytetrahydrobiopterin dehydratase